MNILETSKAIGLSAICLATVASFMYLVSTGNDIGAALLVAIAAFGTAVLIIIEYELRD
jgi:hypothetical protein